MSEIKRLKIEITKANLTISSLHKYDRLTEDISATELDLQKYAECKNADPQYSGYKESHFSVFELYFDDPNADIDYILPKICEELTFISSEGYAQWQLAMSRTLTIYCTAKDTTKNNHNIPLYSVDPDILYRLGKLQIKLQFQFL